jgi:uncharacterized membrane protein
MTNSKLKRALGWASLGLGVPQVLAPAGVARAIGVGDGPRQRGTVTAVGGRELAAAAGLLGLKSPAWLWARVAGDLMDLGLLGRALKNHDGDGLNRTVAATVAVAGITVIDTYAAVTRRGRPRAASEFGLTAAVTVVRPREEVYRQWRRFESLPDFMAHVDDVAATGPGTTHWRASAPFGRTVEWDAQLIDDVPGERISWQSVDGGLVSTEGDVRFLPAPGDQGTEVHVRLRYTVPGGKLGAAVARYFGEDPHQQLDDDLRRFKQVMETGEVVRSEGAPGGKRARQEFPQHPARPLTAQELAEVRS